MNTLRMTSDLRRQLILSAARRCFARHGFAGTTTKSVAAAAAISEGLLFKHFPTKSALYAEILAEECEADPDLAYLLGQEPSTATLVVLVKGMVRPVRYLQEVPDHTLDQYHQRRGRGLLPEQIGQIRIGLALLGQDLGIQRRFGREVLEQQAFRDRGGRRDALGRGSRKTMTGKATPRRAQDQLPPQVAGHAKGVHARE